MVLSALQRARRFGFEELSKRAIAYLYRRTIRKALPTLAEVKYSGIPISRERKFGDSSLPDFLAPHPLEDIHGYEENLIRALRSQVRIGDRVTIVGGGEGVTAVVASKGAGDTGSIVCFEASGWEVQKIKATAVRNKVSKRVTVYHAVVGSAISAYGGPENLSSYLVSPADLPECDVLELDCEGAETIILRNLTIRPRAIVVEAHGVFGAPTKLVKELLENLGYGVEEFGLAEPRIAEICEANDVRVLVGTRSALTTSASELN